MNKYKIELYMDGDMWCALIGNNLEDGISGFGKTLVAAIRELCDEIDNNYIFDPEQAAFETWRPNENDCMHCHNWNVGCFHTITKRCDCIPKNGFEP